MLIIALSGGPSSGKSTSISRIKEEITMKLGMNCLICPETATELIVNGIIPGGRIPLDDFQEIMLIKQLEKENLYIKVAEKFFGPDKTVMICDRGILDQLAYIEKDEFDKILAKHGMTLADVINRYDMVIHLVTAAKGTDCYTTENNAARKETAEEAIALDDRTLAGNTFHPHLKVVDNSTDFEQKIQRVLEIIFSELGAPAPSEIERKYLIRRPSRETLENLDYSSRSDIIQTYLTSKEKDVERRVRQRGSKENGYSFYYTEKTPVSDMERIEKERIISMKEYTNYMAESDTNLHQIYKERYCFVYNNQYFELDLYPFSDEYAIVEIELGDKDDKVEFPPFLKLIKEVTGDVRYKNHTLACSMSLEE